MWIDMFTVRLLFLMFVGGAGFSLFGGRTGGFGFSLMGAMILAVFWAAPRIRARRAGRRRSGHQDT